MGEPLDVLIVGASGRAAAGSAIRAGLRPWVVDFFGDEDLAEIAHQHCVIRDYNELPGAISDWPLMPWFFTGAVENSPALIRMLSEDRPFWGNSLDVIGKVRSPQILAQALAEAGCPDLAIRLESKPPPADGRWMLKPIRSTGGQDVRVWDKTAVETVDLEATLEPAHYFQERAEGEAVSAVFLSSGEETVMVGISRLLPAHKPAPPFGYGGVIGPVRLPEELETQMARQGEVVGRMGLRGLWGMDFVQDGSRVVATEVNPRYTASVELYEYAFNFPLLAVHQRSFEGGIKHAPPDRRSADEPDFLSALRGPAAAVVGKAVVYANRDLTVPSWGEWARSRDSFFPAMPSLADRPHPGSPVAKGHPLCSVLAAGASEDDCREHLKLRLKELQTDFGRLGTRLAIPTLEPA